MEQDTEATNGSLQQQQQVAKLVSRKTKSP